MQWKITRLAQTLGAITLAATSLMAPAETTYPVKPITMYVGFAAGSSTDLIARAVSQRLSQRLGQPIVVQNLVGAGGIIANEAAARAAPDGYTLVTVSGSLTLTPVTYKNLKYDFDKDLSPIGLIGHSPSVMLVNDALPVRTLGEFIDYAKKHPGQLNYGSSGQGGLTHMGTELMADEAGIKLKHIPYRGNGPADVALMAGEVQLVMDPVLLATKMVASKRARALALSGKTRSPLLPDVPTFAEAGMPKYDPWVYWGILGPAKLPSEIVTKLNKALNEVLSSPDLQATLSTTGGVVITPSTPGQMAQALRDDYAKWKTLAEKTGITANE